MYEIESKSAVIAIQQVNFIIIIIIIIKQDRTSKKQNTLKT